MKHYLFAFTLLLPLFLSAELKPEQDPVLLRAKLDILNADRSKSMKKLTEVRMKHIRSDRNLKRMHDNIMTLHRNLAIALDSKKDVRELNNKLITLDSEIADVQKKLDELNNKKTEKK